MNPEGAPESVIPEDSRAYLFRVGILWNWDVVGMIKPDCPLGAVIFMQLLKELPVTEDNRADSVHEEPWQQEHSQIEMQPPDEYIKGHDRYHH
jgi:hypothetical protein